MKIEKNIAFRISDSKTAQSSFGRLKTGESVHARILERLNTTEAIIDFSGKRVRVEFLKGVPKSKSFLLILESREGGTFYFKIQERSDRSEIFARAADFSVFGLDEMKNVNISILQKSMKGGLSGIYAYNLLLIKELKKEGGDKNGRITNVIQNLLKMGLPREDAVFLTFILNSGKGLNYEQLFSLMMILRLAGGQDQKNREKNNLTDNMNKKIQDIIKTINDIKSDEKKEIINQLIDQLTPSCGAEKSAFSSGDILYIDDNESKAVKYILNNNSILISLELTDIGKLEVLIKNDNLQCVITFFCENDKSANYLKNGSDLLISRLKDVLHKNIQIFYYNSKEAAEKIIEIYSFLRLSKKIDVRA